MSTAYDSFVAIWDCMSLFSETSWLSFETISLRCAFSNSYYISNLIFSLSFLYLVSIFLVIDSSSYLVTSSLLNFSDYLFLFSFSVFSSNFAASRSSSSILSSTLSMWSFNWCSILICFLISASSPWIISSYTLGQLGPPSDESVNESFEIFDF